MKKKLKIYEIINDDFDISGDLKDVIVKLQDIVNKYPNAYFKLNEYGYDGAYDI